MGRAIGVTAVLVAIACLSQPCAANTGHTALFVQRPAEYVGLGIQLPLGTRSKPKPTMRLQVRLGYRAQDQANASAPIYRPKGLEFGLSRTGQPALFFNGETAMNAQTRLGFGGSGSNTALIIGGVLLAVVVVAVAAGGAGLGDTCPTVEGSRDHCINP